MKELGVAVSTEVDDPELLLQARRAAAGKAGKTFDSPSRPSPGTEAGTTSALSERADEEVKDIGLGISTVPLGSGSFTPIHSFIHSLIHSFNKLFHCAWLLLGFQLQT